jgi:CRISPR-associated endonuclease/helicase Cas3
MEFYAHSIDGRPVDDWHRLEEHEGTVPDLRTERSRVVESGLSPAKRNAASFAAEFGCGEWGRLAGLWHDLGRYSTFYNK